MTEQRDDLLGESGVRDALRERDPGPAPAALRAWVQGVPDEAQPRRPFELRRPLAVTLSLAAVMLIAVIGLTTLRHLGPLGFAGSSASAHAVPSQSPVASPISNFDPALEGPGISGTPDFSPTFLVVLVCAVLIVMTISVAGWRRLLTAGVAGLLAVWAIVGSFAPVSFLDFGYGLGLNTVRAPQVPGSGEQLLYELAPANGRFSLGLYLHADTLLPIRIEGIVSPGFDYREQFGGILLTALWIDGEPNGGMIGPARPFSPFVMPRNGQSIWLVGRAGACAFGSAFDPSNPGSELGFEIIDSLDLRVSVFGWPRTVHLQLPLRLVEPRAQSCPGPSPAPGG